MMYQSSKGPVEISTMPLSYAKNALNKLRRTEPERAAEIEALDAHVAKLAAEATEESLNPRAVVGGNNPPPEETIKPEWEAVKVHMDDLLTEAANWADGVKIENQAQADKVSDLRRMLQDAANLADKARVAEKEPHDKVIAEIQDRYNEYIAPMKNKRPGKVSKAATALGNLLDPWLRKLDDEKRERENRAREEAEAKEAAALAARQDAKKSDDLAKMDEAESLLAEAEKAAAVLKAVESERVQAGGEFRASGWRANWVATPIEGEVGKALIHFAKEQPERVKAFVQQLANEAVARGVRKIPGYLIEDKKKVA